MFERFARVRVVEPMEGGKPRPCDVQVSNDDGETWKTLATADTELLLSEKGLPLVTITLIPVPGLVEFDCLEPSPSV